MKQVVLVDDHPIFRAGIKHLLAVTNRFSVVHESNSIADLESYLKKPLTQLAEVLFVIDISLPDGNGFDVLPLVAAAGGRTQHCAMLSMHDAYEYAEHAFSMNAYGYVVKSDDQENIITCLESLVNGQPYMSPGVKKQGQQNIETAVVNAEDSEPRPDFSSLTKRESAILKLVAEGKTNKDISDQLFLSQRTVENHRAKICRKLGVSGANGLITLTIKHKHAIKYLT
ncbi:MAG: response regulator transcription factor [Pseudomonadota bacterium]